MRAARSLAGSTTTTTCVLTPRSVAARQSRRQVRARDPPRGWPPTPLRPPPPLPSDEGDGGSEGMASSSNHQMTKEASRSKRKSLLKPRTLEMSEGAEGLRSAASPDRPGSQCGTRAAQQRENDLDDHEDRTRDG